MLRLNAYKKYAEDTITNLNKLDLTKFSISKENGVAIKSELQSLKEELENRKSQFNNIYTTSELTRSIIETTNNIYDDTNTQLAELQQTFDTFMGMQGVNADNNNNVPQEIEVPKKWIGKAINLLLFTGEMVAMMYQISTGDYVQGAMTGTGATLALLSENRSYKIIGHMMCATGLAMSFYSPEILSSLNQQIIDYSLSVSSVSNTLLNSSSQTIISTVRSIFESLGLDKNSFVFEWLGSSKPQIAGLIGPGTSEIVNAEGITITKQVEFILNNYMKSNTANYNALQFQAAMGHINKIPAPQGVALAVYDESKLYHINVLKNAVQKILQGVAPGTSLRDAYATANLKNSQDSTFAALATLGGVGALLMLATPLAPIGAAGAAVGGLVFAAGTPLYIQEAITWLARFGGRATILSIAPHLEPWIPQGL